MASVEAERVFKSMENLRYLVFWRMRNGSTDWQPCGSHVELMLHYVYADRAMVDAAVRSFNARDDCQTAEYKYEPITATDEELIEEWFPNSKR